MAEQNKTNGDSEAVRRIARARLQRDEGLDLSGLRLTEWFQWLDELFGHLRTLDLSSNELTTLPAESLGRLVHLQELRLSDNRLTSLPESLGQLKELQRLYLPRNRLTSLPESLGQLDHLQSLGLSDNRLTSLPESLGQLKELQELHLPSNQLTSLPESLGQLKKLQELQLFRNRLTSLPESLGQLKGLQMLGLSDNRLTSLPEWLGQFDHLQSLELSKNRLTSLPEWLGQLAQLGRLRLSDNQLTSLPESLGQLAQLERLDLSNNQLTALPESLKNLKHLQVLYLHGNAGLRIPPEILGPTYHDVLRRDATPTDPTQILRYYYRTCAGKQPLNEVKLILLGRGGVGKTSLVNRLVYNTFNPDSAETEGIQITQWAMTVEDEEVRLHMWDFGGQEILHATHQFFLTERSLYVVVLSGREGSGDADAEYWLKLVASFGGGSPVLVVLNKMGQYRFDVNRGALRQKYPNIREFVATDCKDGRGLDELNRSLLGVLSGWDAWRVAFPATWFAIKDRLAGMTENYLTFDQYQEICAANGEKVAEAQEQLACYLHRLGIALNYRDDPRLRDTHVLNPNWVTTGVYKIINADVLARNQGLLRLRDLADILDPVAYPRETHRFLLDLMKRFELCFAHPGGNEDYLVPQLLSKDQQAELPEFASEVGLRFRYVYPVIPEGLIPRFIVRTYTLSESQPRWRTGVVLEFESHRALVKADREARTVEIDVRGPTARGRRNLLAIIRSNFAEIHPSSLRPEAMVPVPGHPEVAVSYEALRVREATGRRNFDLVVGTTVIDLDASTLLDGVDTEAQARSRAGDERPGLSQDKPSGVEAVRLFVSYAREDERMKDEFKAHIELLQVQRDITAWDDRMIPAGDEWDKKIHEKLDRADIFVLLVSAKFLASKYCREVELPTVMRRHEAGQARVLPVIVRKCLWRSAPFAKLNTLPTDAKAVELWERRNSAWTVVAEAVVEAAKWVRNERARRR